MIYDEVGQRETMAFFKLEQSKALYHADFVLYGIAITALATFLTVASPRQQWLETISFVVLGLISWTVIEYALHRYILHVLQPFRHWHTLHHRRPKALIFAPTILSTSLITTLIFLPALLVDGLWHACALTLGIVTGYFTFAVTHHAIHHWNFDNEWLRKRKRWHAVHHHYNEQFGCYGVTSTFWDHVFGSAYQAPDQLPNKLKLANARKTLRTRNVLLTTHVNTNNNAYWP